MVSAADIQALPSGEFASVADPIVQTFIDEAGREIDATAFGDRYDDAVTYLAAHLLAAAIAGSSGASGPVTSVTAGALSKQYATPYMMDGDALMITSYGRRYKQIRHACVGGPQAL